MAEEYKGFEDTKMRRYQVDPIADQSTVIHPQLLKYKNQLDDLYANDNKPNKKHKF